MGTSVSHLDRIRIWYKYSSLILFEYSLSFIILKSLESLIWGIILFQSQKAPSISIFIRKHAPCGNKKILTLK